MKINRKIKFEPGITESDKNKIRDLAATNWGQEINAKILKDQNLIELTYDVNGKPCRSTIAMNNVKAMRGF